jgi:membrane protein DedA with SNARE-associated domain
MRPSDIDRADRWFSRNGTKAVFFGRLLPVVRTFISLRADMARMSPTRFGIYTLAGCIPWTVALAWAGYAVGANWQHVISTFHGVTYVPHLRTTGLQFGLQFASIRPGSLEYAYAA